MKKWRKTGEICIMRKLVISAHHQVLLGELDPADLLMSLWLWNLGCQEKTIKHRVIKFLIGGPGFRLSNQMRTEDTRTRLKVKNVNEMVDNERETERNCTYAAYLRRKMGVT